MKKLFSIAALASILMLSLPACRTSSDAAPSAAADQAKEIASIAISSLPESEKYARTYSSEEKIDSIRSYIHRLTLSDLSSENPAEYSGMAYVIEITYEDDSVKTYYHYGNKFFKIAGQEWKMMDFRQANELERLILNAPSD